MLGKLLKHEFVATSRFFLIAYPALVVMSFLNRFLFNTNQPVYEAIEESLIYQILSVVSVFVYSGLIVGIFVGCTIMMIQRFYKSMLGDEGYLMNTLPASPWQHITAKMLTCAVWLLGSLLFTAVSIMILAWEVPNIPEFFRWATAYLLGQGASPALIYTESVIMLLLSLVTFMLPFYASIMLGQFWKKHRVLGAFLAYIGLMFIGQAVSGFFARGWFQNWFGGVGSYYGGHALSDAEFFGQAFHSLMLPIILLTIAEAAVMFLITHFLMERRLNLE